MHWPQENSGGFLIPIDPSTLFATKGEMCGISHGNQGMCVLIVIKSVGGSEHILCNGGLVHDDV